MLFQETQVGTETAKVLALRGVHIVMVVSNISVGREVKEVILKTNPNCEGFMLISSWGMFVRLIFVTLPSLTRLETTTSFHSSIYIVQIQNLIATYASPFIIFCSLIRLIKRVCLKFLWLIMIFHFFFFLLNMIHFDHVVNFNFP